jgi:germination protein M
MSKTPQKKRKKKKTKHKINWGRALPIFLLAAALGFGAYMFWPRSLGPDGGQADDPPTPPPPGFIEINFYFPGAAWEPEPRQIEISDQYSMIQAVLTGLREGPRRSGLDASVPAEVAFEWFSLSDGAVELSFSANFSDLTPGKRIILRSSLVWTLTELDFVEGVLFYLENEPLMRDGELFGLRNRQNTNLDTGVPPPDFVTVVLFFPNEQMTRLVAVERRIPHDPLVSSIETLIVEALMQGPDADSGLFHAFADVTLFGQNPVNRAPDSDLVSVDFTSDFLSHLAGGSTLEEMTVFSLVNTLTHRPEVRQVRIFIEGERIPYEEDSIFHIDLSRPIEGDISLIIDN